MMKKRQVGQMAYDGDSDRRIIEKMLREKSISPDELHGYIESIPDASDNADEFTVELSKRS
jgi:hypothetical protein